jgi:small subunit ribosomal protein S21
MVTKIVWPADSLNINLFTPQSWRIIYVYCRFKREVSKAGIFPDMKKNRFFEMPIEKRKRKDISKHRQWKRKFRI